MRDWLRDDGGCFLMAVLFRAPLSTPPHTQPRPSLLLSCRVKSVHQSLWTRTEVLQLGNWGNFKTNAVFERHIPQAWRGAFSARLFSLLLVTSHLSNTPPLRHKLTP